MLFVFFVVKDPGSASAQQFDPQYRFRVLPTEHFLIYFHQGEDALAGRLAVIAEDTWRKLQAPLGRSAPRRTHVILVDQTDIANGWATPIPRDIVAIYAVWPDGSDSLRSDDWLRLVFTHEFSHVLHLDRSRGWAGAVRKVFGRLPFAFPNLFLPMWQIEGLAVYEESVVTGGGRLHAGEFRAVVDEAARAGRPLPLDRLNGGLTRWPAGEGAYAYGLGFHVYLSDRYGAGTLGALADRTAGSLPYFGSLAFRRVFGKSLGALWKEYESSLAPGTGLATSVPSGTGLARANQDPSPPLRLTHHNYGVVGPRFAPPRCSSGCATEIYYSVRNADELPALYRLSIEAGVATPPESVTSRILGSTLAPAHDRIYFDQQELRRNSGMYSDLYSLDRATDHVRELTHEARLIDPDLSPDGTHLVAVRIGPGQRELVLLPLTSPDAVGRIATLAAGTETQFNAPRWSPDGRTIAVERQRLGELPSIVLVDAATGAIRTLAAGPDVRWATPTWTARGSVIAAAAGGDAPFNLFDIDVTTGRSRQLTHSTGGATWPVVSPDGTTIVYVGYTADGFDLFQIPYTASAFAERVPLDAASADSRPAQPASQSGERSERSATAGTPEPYRPWRTLPPTSWSPIIERSDEDWGVGAEVSGRDVLGYHGYAASVRRWQREEQDTAGGVSDLDWSASYAYMRRRPSVFVSTSRDTAFYGNLVDDDVDRRVRVRQDTDVEAGIVFGVAHVRSSHLAFASFLKGTSRVLTRVDDRTLTRAAARVAWSYLGAKFHANSISQEGGPTFGVTAEAVRRAFGASADATTVTGDVRWYSAGAAVHHVFAVRLAAGRSVGDRLAGRLFTLGGGGGNESPTDFGSDAISLLRGFPSNTFAGTRVALLNAEYRFPLARVERGAGTWPFFLHTLHAAVFADAGHAWTHALAARDLKTSIGAELAARIVLGYWAPVSVAGGVARGHDGSGRVPDQTTWYGRVGYAF